MYRIIEENNELVLECVDCKRAFADTFDAVTWHDNCNGEK